MAHTNNLLIKNLLLMIENVNESGKFLWKLLISTRNACIIACIITMYIFSINENKTEFFLFFLLSLLFSHETTNEGTKRREAYYSFLIYPCI